MPVNEQNKAASKLCLRLAAMHGTCSFANGHSVNCIFTRKSPVLGGGSYGVDAIVGMRYLMIFLIS